MSARQRPNNSGQSQTSPNGDPPSGSYDLGLRRPRFGESLDATLRAAKDLVLAPVARRCFGISPNTVTVSALFVGLGCCAASASGRPMVALLLWLGNRLLDGLDGAIARAHGSSSDFGGYFDIVCDFVVYAALPASRAAGIGGGGHAAKLEAWIAVSVLQAVFFVNAAALFCLSAVLEKRAAGAAARGEITTVTMVDALVGGFEAAALFCLVIVIPDPLLPAVLYTFAALVTVCIVQRVVWARKALC